MTDTPNTPEVPESESGPAVGKGLPEPEAAESAASAASASEAWGDVLSAMGELGNAVSAWAKAAANEPENRRHLDELRSGIGEMAKQADAAFSSVNASDLGKQVSEGAQQAGEAIGAAASELSQAAAPHVATAFAGLADVFGRAAQKMGEAAMKSDPEPHTRPAPEPPQADAAEAPSAAAAPATEDAPDAP